MNIFCTQMSKLNGIKITNVLGGSLIITNKPYDWIGTTSNTEGTLCVVPSGVAYPLLPYHLDMRNGLSEKVLLLTAQHPQQHMKHKTLISILVIDMRDRNAMKMFFMDPLTRLAIKVIVPSSANEKQYVASSSTVLQTSTHKLPLQRLLGYDASNITLDDVNGREYIRSMLHSRGYLLIEGVSDDVSLIKDYKEEFA